MSPTEGYLRCLGQLRWSSEKLASLVGEEGGQNPIHLESAYTELIHTCDKVVAMLGDTKNLAIAGLHAVQHQTEDESKMLENNPRANEKESIAKFEVHQILRARGSRVAVSGWSSLISKIWRTILHYNISYFCKKIWQLSQPTKGGHF